MSLRVSTPEKEGVYQASKYLKYQVLCEVDELARLLESLSPFSMYHLTGLSNGEELESEVFLSAYGSWIQELKEGRIPKDEDLRKVLACAWTKEREALWKQEVPGNKYIIKMAKPLVQVQAHFFTYSSLDEIFRPMSMGPNQIFWGLQFSFPQIYQHPKTMELLEVEEELNCELFKKIKLWVREETRATPFIVSGKKTNVPIRLGKSCFSWINSHKQLQEQKIGVYAS